MSLITIQDALGWVRSSKFTMNELNADLLDQIESEVLGRLASTYDISLWTTPATTPRLVRTAIAKLYVSYEYMKAYAEDSDNTPPYAIELRNNSQMLVTGITDGTIELPDATPSSASAGQPSFYPTDLSSSQEPGCWGDNSLGPASFSMGKVF